jgi:DNA-binding XRE family transcriptional regulator
MDAEGRVRLRLEPTEQPGEVRAILRVAWGRRFVVPSEFSLSFLGTPTATVIRAVLNELKDDGLRDWLTLHRMAARQGRVGHFTWTWAEHKQATAYEARIRHSSVSEDEARDTVMRRLWALHGADLWVEGKNEAGELVRHRVGEQGLISIDATRHRGDNIEAAMIRINPALYASARHDTEEKHFTPIPEAVLRLNGPALRLGAMLAFEFRWARDAGANVEIEESELFLLAGIHRDGKPKPGELTHARRTLQNVLTTTLEALGEGASFECIEEPTGRRYVIRSPNWLRDALVHGVPPVLPEACPSSLPRTGEQLVEWRKKKDWTQERVAKQLGVTKRTVQSAESRSKATLPPSMLLHLDRLLEGEPLPEPIQVPPLIIDGDPTAGDPNE